MSRGTRRITALVALLLLWAAMVALTTPSKVEAAGWLVFGLVVAFGSEALAEWDGRQNRAHWDEAER